MLKLFELGQFITQAVQLADLWGSKWWQGQLAQETSLSSSMPYH